MEISTLFKAPISFLPSIIRHLELDRFGMNNYQLPSSNSNHHLPTSSPSHDGFPHRNQHQPLQTHPHGRPQECRAQGQARTRKAPKEDRKARQENREARQEDRKGRQEAPRVDQKGSRLQDLLQVWQEAHHYLLLGGGGPASRSRVMGDILVVPLGFMFLAPWFLGVSLGFVFRVESSRLFVLSLLHTPPPTFVGARLCVVFSSLSENYVG
jgi:hypothetical protein